MLLVSYNVIWDYFVLLPSLVKVVARVTLTMIRPVTRILCGGGGGGGGANEIKVDQATEMYFILSDQFI